MELEDNKKINEFVENEFFIIDSNNLDDVDSKLYGFIIKNNQIIIGGKVDDETEPTCSGTYIWVKRENNEIIIHQDFAGSYGLYLYEKDDYFAVSNSFLKLVEFLKKNHDISFNYKNAKLFLSLGLWSFSILDTLVNEITNIPRDNILKIDIETKKLNREVIDYKEGTVYIDSKEGVELLDNWFFKWINLFRLIINNNERVLTYLNDSFDSRLILTLLIASNVDLGKIVINPTSFGTESYKTLSQIADRYDFNLETIQMENFKNINVPVDISFYTKLGFDKLFISKSTFSNLPIFEINDFGGQYIRKRAYPRPQNFIREWSDYSKTFSPEFCNSVKDGLNKNFDFVRSIYNIDFFSNVLTQELHKETFVKNFLGKKNVESYLLNRIPISPLLDSDLYKFKRNGEKWGDEQLLISVIYTRYCPGLIDYEFFNHQTINEKTIKYAMEINNKYPLNEALQIAEDENLIILKENEGNKLDEFGYSSKDNSIFQREDFENFIWNVFCSDLFKTSFQKYFYPGAYTKLASTVDKTKNNSFVNIYSAITVMKIIDEIQGEYTYKNNSEWLNHFLTEKESYDEKNGEINPIFINKLLKYATARIYIKNIGNEDNSVVIMENSDAYSKIFSSVPWLKDDEGSGVLIDSGKGIIDLKIKCVNKGQFKLFLGSIDFRDKRNNILPIYINYTKLMVNDNCIFDSGVSACYEKSYEYVKDGVEDNEIINIHIEWEPFDEKSILRGSHD